MKYIPSSTYADTARATLRAARDYHSEQVWRSLKGYRNDLTGARHWLNEAERPR